MRTRAGWPWNGITLSQRASKGMKPDRSSSSYLFFLCSLNTLVPPWSNLKERRLHTFVSWKIGGNFGVAPHKVTAIFTLKLLDLSSRQKPHAVFPYPTPATFGTLRNVIHAHHVHIPHFLALFTLKLMDQIL